MEVPSIAQLPLAFDAIERAGDPTRVSLMPQPPHLIPVMNNSASFELAPVAVHPAVASTARANPAARPVLDMPASHLAPVVDMVRAGLGALVGEPFEDSEAEGPLAYAAGGEG
jgi:hypothetical protein